MDNATRTTLPDSDDSDSWRSPYEAEEEGSDLTTEIRSLMDHGVTDPGYAIDMACAAAEASETLCVLLRSQWALYTPQQAATVVSALFAQVSAAAEALRGVDRVLAHMAARGDLGHQTDHGDERPRTTLPAAADALDRVLGGHASQSVELLLRTPSTAPLPADAHEAVAAVARLLGPRTPMTRCDPTTPTQGIVDSLSTGCGCEIDIESQGQVFSFGRGDSCWSLDLKVVMPDGSAIYDSVAELGTSLDTAHPDHLVEEILRVLPQ
ncbi:hypothetical protein [Streptomyces sp. Isolate_45]|uniref:hypothetical protein n=1 Tax=Streptomyces sp. Isolate_45 TaxID=2950111 RepID=UPI002481C6C9|nr:hypothetical protein [Streptomyces sp. Isolate_45]MDA5279935.1 hypothetical protein [Streptomyces sp. Isolate_45]